MRLHPPALALWPNVVLGALVTVLVCGCTRFDPASEDAAVEIATSDTTEPASDGENTPKPGTDAGLDALSGTDVAGDDAFEEDDSADTTASYEDVETEVLADSVPSDAEGATPLDTDSVDTSTPEDAQPDAITSDAGDAQGPEPDAPKPCIDQCPEPDVFRCLDGVIEATERCSLNAETGCLQWEPFEVCADNACKGAALCVNGACGHDGNPTLVCSSDDPCIASVCDETSESCTPTPLAGGACDDGEACTTLDSCQPDGSCIGTPDASVCPCTTDDDCLSYDPDGEACDDRYLCAPTGPNSAATACIFSPEPTTCASVPGACSVLNCEPSSGACVEDLLPADTPCDDGDPCTNNESCDTTGQCQGFPDAVSCACEDHADCLSFDPDGNACNGRYLCTDLGWASGAKACVYAPEPIACEAPEATCLTAGCIPASGECIDIPVADGLSCDDDNACSASSTCQVGVCTGFELVSCPPAGPCDNVACDPDTGGCIVASVSENCCGNGQLEAGEACDTPASWCTASCSETECVAGSLALGQGCLQFDTGAGVLGSTFTVDFFIHPKGQNGTILASGSGVNAPWRLELEGTGNTTSLVWYEVPSSGEGTASVVGPSLVLDAWQHVTLTRDATGGAQVDVSFYKDGLSYGSTSITPLPFVHADWGWLGCQTSNTSMLPALIDEFRWREGVKAPTEPPSAPHASAGTLLLYHFDDVTPGVAVDASGWGRHGAWQGCFRNDASPFDEDAGTCVTDWCNRSALLFDPAQEGVATVPPSPAMAQVEAFTVEFYLRLDDTNTTQIVISQSTSEPGGADWHIQAVNGGGAFARLQWVEGQDAGVFASLDNIITSPPLNGDVTYHIAFVRSLDNTGEVSGRWFIDGTPGPASALQSPKGMALTNLPIYLGSQAGSTGFLHGFLDELRISKGATYDAAFEPGVILETPETIGLYRFDIGAGSWAYPELWGSLPPMTLEGVNYATSGATAAGPCL